MAQAFSTALDNAFMLDSDVNNLSLSIDQKYVTGKLACCHLHFRLRPYPVRSHGTNEGRQEATNDDSKP